jgi:hypothetical protein
VGQFTSADSVQGPNRYEYVGGNPETITDPTGQFGACAGSMPDGRCTHPRPSPKPRPAPTSTYQHYCDGCDYSANKPDPPTKRGCDALNYAPPCLQPGSHPSNCPVSINLCYYGRGANGLISEYARRGADQILTHDDDPTDNLDGLSQLIDELNKIEKLFNDDVNYYIGLATGTGGTSILSLIFPFIAKIVGILGTAVSGWFVGNLLAEQHAVDSTIDRMTGFLSELQTHLTEFTDWGLLSIQVAENNIQAIPDQEQNSFPLPPLLGAAIIPYGNLQLSGSYIDYSGGSNGSIVYFSQ